MDNQIMVKAEAIGGSQPAIVATVPVTARPSMTVLASSCTLSPIPLLAQTQALSATYSAFPQMLVCLH
jgi:hypothetical protein